jgi:UDP-N-acetylmuramate--alanine ligase
MAIAMAVNFGTPTDCIASLSFIQRDKKSLPDKTDNLVYIDDYAHHPTEINAVYQAVRELYPDKKFLPCFSLIYSAEQKILLMILRKVYLNLTSYCC